LAYDCTTRHGKGKPPETSQRLRAISDPSFGPLPTKCAGKIDLKSTNDYMEDLVPLLDKRAQGRDISGLSAYEQK
jgi:hypothetical protein